jgi:hypothetical protein
MEQGLLRLWHDRVVVHGLSSQAWPSNQIPNFKFGVKMKTAFGTRQILGNLIPDKKKFNSLERNSDYTGS